MRKKTATYSASRLPRSQAGGIDDDKATKPIGGFRAFAARSSIVVSRALIERVRNLEQ